MKNEIINKENEEFKEPKIERDLSKSNLVSPKDFTSSGTNNIKIVLKNFFLINLLFFLRMRH